MLIIDVGLQEVTQFLKVTYVCNAENNKNNVAICIAELSNLLSIEENVSVYFKDEELMFEVDDKLNKFKCVTTMGSNLDFNVLTVMLK